MSSKIIYRTLLAGALAVGVGLSTGIGLPANASALPAEFQAKLLVRILPYDRTLAERTNSMRIAVLFAPGNADSEAAATALVAQIAKVGHGKRIQGTPLSAEKVSFGGKADLDARNKREPYAAFFITQGLGPMTPQIVQIAQQHGVLTIGSLRRHVKDGAAVSLVAEGDSPKIVVNLKAAQAARVAFSSAFLSLAETQD